MEIDINLSVSAEYIADVFFVVLIMGLNIKSSQVSCIILAGGEGKRFNRKDKGLVKLGGKPLIQHIIDRISRQANDIVISANRHTDEYKKYSSTVIKDKTIGFQGPLAGIAACIPECHHEWILVLPCDVPVLPNNLVQRFSDEGHGSLIVARAHGQKQLVFLMHVSLKDDLDAFLRQGNHKAMTWIEQQNPVEVSFEEDTGIFVNINSPRVLELLETGTHNKQTV